MHEWRWNCCVWRWKAAHSLLHMGGWSPSHARNSPIPGRWDSHWYRPSWVVRAVQVRSFCVKFASGQVRTPNVWVRFPSSQVTSLGGHTATRARRSSQLARKPPRLRQKTCADCRSLGSGLARKQSLVTSKPHRVAQVDFDVWLRLGNNGSPGDQ